MSELFKGIFDSAGAAVIAPGQMLLCLGCSLICGLILTLCYVYRARYTRSFAATLALLPSVVCVVIMMVNGNVGAGVAVAGAFSLVRFRSVPGTAREIGALFLAMGAGLVAGMGYLAYALLISLVLGLISLVYNALTVRVPSGNALHKTLYITVPEDLNYSEVFEPILQSYARQFELVKVKTTNMGSLYRLTYDLTLKEANKEKQLIDELRCHNGNLEITLCRQENTVMEL